MAKIMIFYNPQKGHSVPTLSVVRALTARGHSVTCIVWENDVASVEQAGARAVAYPSPFAHGKPDVSRFDIPSSFLDDRMTDGATRFMARDARYSLPAALAALRSDKPDIVVSDQFAVAGYLVSDHLNVANVHLHVMDPIFCNVDLTDDFVRGEIEAACHISELDVPRTLSVASPCNVVLLPEELVSAPDRLDASFHFVGGCVELRDGDRTEVPNAAFLERSPLIFVSLGTLGTDRTFFQTCARAFAETPYHAILEVSPNPALNGIEKYSDNVEIWRGISPSRILKHVDCFVCHGGMASVMESICHGVPLVLTPRTFIHAEFAKIVGERNLGVDLGLFRSPDLPGSEHLPEMPTADVIRDAVTRAMNDPKIKRSVTSMKESLRCQGGAKVAVDAIEKQLLAAT